MNSSDDYDDRLSALALLQLAFWSIIIVLSLFLIILSALESYGIVGAAANYLCFCIFASVISIILFFIADYQESLCKRANVKIMIRFFHLFFWPALPISLPFLIIAILLAQTMKWIHSKISSASDSEKPFTSPRSDNPHNASHPEASSESCEFRICHTIWLCTYHISRHCAFSNNAFAQGHIWATLLYIATKHIRDQDTVDRIYSHFEAAASDIGDGDPYSPGVISLVRHGYQQFAPILNASGIDPRTPDGIQSLWELLKKEDFKHKDPHPSAVHAYFDYAQILISNVTTYHKTDTLSVP